MTTSSAVEITSGGAKDRSAELASLPPAASGAHIYVVEGQPEWALLLDYYLSSQGYRIEVIDRGDVAESRLSLMLPDLVVLDWATPGLSGIELLRRLRRKAAGERLPILLIASSRDARDAAFAISSGADDVVTAPFSLGEIALRVSALLRQPPTHEPVAMHKTQDLGALRLNPTAERLFAVLSRSAGQVLARRQLHETLWGRDVSFDKHAVDVHIARLRQILQRHWRVDPIELVGDDGYRYVRE